MTRDDALKALADWNPDADVDLSDDVARWIAEDGDVAAAFDARFDPIVDDQTLAVPTDARDRVLAPIRPSRRSWAVPVGVALAAGACLTVLGTGTLLTLAVDAQPVDSISRESQLVLRRGASPERSTLDFEEGGYATDRTAAVDSESTLLPEVVSGTTAFELSGNTELPRDALRGRGTRQPNGDPYDGRWRESGRNEASNRYRGTKPTDSTVDQGLVHEPTENRVRVTAQKLQIVERVAFERSSAQVEGRSAPLLDEIAVVLQDHPELRVEVAGHADAAEAEAGILATSRANAVRSELIRRGVDESQLVPVGYADGRPLVQGRDRAENRRSEFRILEADEPPPAPVVEPVNSEHYTDYGHHAFVHVNEDPLSTFSIDVDTASYSVTRRKLTEGFLPPAAAVRVEEFVNAQRYDYGPPRSDPFSVDFEGAPSPFNPRTHVVRIGIQGRKVSTDARKPANLVFLVDTSGSMSSPDKLGLVQHSLRMLTQELKDGDTVAIVAYAGSAGVVLEPTPISERQTILRAIDRLTSGGSTAMGQGIELAYQLAEERRSDGAISRVIIASDGDANVGPSHHSALSELVRDHALRGVTLTTLGFGSGNYRDTTMERLANDGDGNYFYIDTEDEARKVLVDRLTSTIQVIARDVKLQVEWTDAVLAYRLVGYENRDIADRDFRNDSVDAGEVGAGHQVTALYEVALRPQATGDLATLRLRAKAPGPDAPAGERSWTLPVEALRPSLSESSNDFRISLAAASFAELLRGSPHVHGAGYDDIAELARGALRAEYAEDRELLGLIERAGQLTR